MGSGGFSISALLAVAVAFGSLLTRAFFRCKACGEIVRRTKAKAGNSRRDV